MAELDKSKPVSLEELMLATLAQTDALTKLLTKLLIEKGVITDAEFKQKLLEERAVYQRILNPTTQ
jgi:mannitol/fructose-specific phosphotransferase system IIA component (Ntr-type)